jgi:hypothetical protein
VEEGPVACHSAAVAAGIQWVVAVGNQLAVVVESRRTAVAAGIDSAAAEDIQSPAVACLRRDSRYTVAAMVVPGHIHLHTAAVEVAAERTVAVGRMAGERWVRRPDMTRSRRT